MNQKISAAFGQLYQRLPLKKSPHIHCENALRMDWKIVLSPEQCSYVLGKAHAELGRAVEKCYRPEPFDSDRQRVEFLFALYEKLTAPLLPVTPKTKSRRSQTAATTRKARKQKTPALYSQKIPPGKNTAESEAAAAHFWMAKEEPPKPGEK